MSKETTKALLDNIEKSNKAFYQILKEGFRIVTSNKEDNIALIYAIVQIYGISKNVHLTKREVEIMTMFIKYGTSSEGRKSIIKQLKITGGSISQYVIKLKSKGLLIKNYEDTNVCYVNPELLKITEYIIEKKGNLLIRFE